MSCCPQGSLPSFKQGEPTLKGRVVKVEDLEIYVVGKGEKCVIWNYDIHGFNSGRTKQLADQLAESGFLVMIPDYFRGGWQAGQKVA